MHSSRGGVREDTSTVLLCASAQIRFKSAITALTLDPLDRCAICITALLVKFTDPLDAELTLRDPDEVRLLGNLLDPIIDDGQRLNEELLLDR